MKTRKDKNNNHSILVCTVSILLALGMITGCSVRESAPSEAQSEASFSSGESTVYSNEDSFQYLTLEFVKQKDGWKIQFYGTEQ